MTDANQGSKFNIQFGTVTGGNFKVGDEVHHYYGNAGKPDSDQVAPASPVKRTILFLASSPGDQARLRLDVESREIDEGLRRSQRRDEFNLEKQWAVRTEDLRRALLSYEPQLVHFSGYAGHNAGLMLENEVGNAKYVPAAALAELFRLFADRGLECVVLNACYSVEQAEAIAQHIPFVIGMSEMLQDDAAIKFAIGFYDAVGAGWSYEKAYALGRNAIALEGIPQSHVPKLHQKPA